MAETATYAIVKTGGKQYKVAVGDVVKVEKLDSEPGASVSLPVALVVNGAKVTVTGSGDNIKVNDATVICGGVHTANATVYLIDSVLLPPAN